MTDVKDSNEKLFAVEGLRGIACLVVVLAHLCFSFYPYIQSASGRITTKLGEENGHIIESWLFNSPFTFFISGTSAVFVFFVLSGYILTEVAGKSGNRLQRIASMSIKRYPRLMIPALFSTVFSFCLLEFTDVNSVFVSSWIQAFGDFEMSLAGAIFNGSIDSFFISGKSQYNWVLWTMQIELIGSFVIFILCFNLYKYNIKGVPVTIVIATVVLLLLKVITVMLAFGLISFVIGFYFSLYGFKISNRIAFLLLFSGLYLAGARNNSDSYSVIEFFLGTKMYTITSFLSGSLIVYSVFFNKYLNSLFSKKMFVFLGKVSFSVYLIHLPVISVFSVFLFDKIFKHTNDYYISSIITSIISLVFIYFLSIYVYKYVDKAGMKISNLLEGKVMGYKKYRFSL